MDPTQPKTDVGLFLREATRILPFLVSLMGILLPRKAFYYGKLIGILWFEGDLPENETRRIYFHINLSWLDEMRPDGLEKIEALEETYLKWITYKMGKPAWASKKNLVDSFSLADFQNTLREIYEKGNWKEPNLETRP